jgi:hypothetical protein
MQVLLTVALASQTRWFRNPISVSISLASAASMMDEERTLRIREIGQR